MVKLHLKNWEITEVKPDNIAYDTCEAVEVKARSGKNEIVFFDYGIRIPQFSTGFLVDLLLRIDLSRDKGKIDVILDDKRDTDIYFYNVQSGRRCHSIVGKFNNDSYELSRYNVENGYIEIDTAFRDVLALKNGLDIQNWDVKKNSLLIIPSCWLWPIEAKWNYDLSEEEKSNNKIDSLNIRLRFDLSTIQSVTPKTMEGNLVTSKNVEVECKDGQFFFVDDKKEIPQQSKGLKSLIEANIYFPYNKKNIAVVKNKNIKTGIQINDNSSKIKTHTIIARFLSTSNSQYGITHGFSLDNCPEKGFSFLIIKGSVAEFNSGKEEFQDGDNLVITDCLLKPSSIKWPYIFTDKDREIYCSDDED